MADISKCADEKCPSKQKCKRYTALSGFWQAYTNFNRQEDEQNCNHFIDNEKDKTNRCNRQH